MFEGIKTFLFSWVKKVASAINNTKNLFINFCGKTDVTGDAPYGVSLATFPLLKLNLVPDSSPFQLSDRKLEHIL